jgi:hypothetical protein
MRELRRFPHLKIDADFIAHLSAILKDSGGELSTRTLAVKYRIKAKAVREAACRYPNILQLNLIRGRIPNHVRPVEKFVPSGSKSAETSIIETMPTDSEIDIIQLDPTKGIPQKYLLLGLDRQSG